MVISAVSTGCGSEVSPSGPAAGATRVFANAKVYTVDPAKPWAEAIGVDDRGVIVSVGTDHDVRAAAAPNAEIIDLAGAFVMPGIQDPHQHVLEAGVNLNACLLPERRPLRSYEQPLARCARNQPGQSWVRAAGAPAAEFPDSGRELPVDVLDRAVPDRPAIVLDDLGHSVWTNTLGLRAAGIGTHTPDPVGGRIGRDPKTGRLTGVLFEDAQHVVRDAATEDPAVKYEGLLVGLDQLRRNGITSVSDAGGYWTQGHPEQWQRALDEGKLTARARNCVYVYAGKPIEEQMPEVTRRFSDNPDSLLSFNMAKIYVDGILDLGTAYLLKPTPQDSDKGYFPTSTLNDYASRLHAAGFQIKFHVIGDAAAREALNAIEAIPADKAQIAARRHHLTHTYLVSESDRPRFRALGVGADFQMAPEVVAHAKFGDQTLIPSRSIFDAGALVTLSSDYDADPISPWGTLQRAITRKEEALPDLATAVAAMTIRAAELLRHDDRTGSLQVGKFADLAVLDRNIFEVQSDRIGKAHVIRTVLAGRTIFQA